METQTEKEQHVYGEFVKSKQECATKIGRARSNSRFRDLYDLNTIVKSINQINVISDKIYSKMNADFDSTDKTCSQHWANTDDKDPSTANIDCISLMQDKIDNFDKFDSLMKAFESDLVKSSNNLKETITKFTTVVNAIDTININDNNDTNTSGDENDADVEEYKVKASFCHVHVLLTRKDESVSGQCLPLTSGPQKCLLC